METCWMMVWERYMYSAVRSPTSTDLKPKARSDMSTVVIEKMTSRLCSGSCRVTKPNRAPETAQSFCLNRLRGRFVSEIFQKSSGPPHCYWRDRKRREWERSLNIERLYTMEKGKSPHHWQTPCIWIGLRCRPFRSRRMSPKLKIYPWFYITKRWQGHWWFGSRQRAKDGINAQSAAAFFKSIKEESSREEVVGTLGKSYKWELRESWGVRRSWLNWEVYCRSNHGMKWDSKLVQDIQNIQLHILRREALILHYSHLLVRQYLVN